MIIHEIVSPEYWLEQRRKLLVREKEFTRARDKLARAQRALPWERVEKDYTFETTDGPAHLAGLFGGASQLIVYHFMFGPDWEQPCRSCSFLADNFNGISPHLRARDVSLVAVSRAPIERIEEQRKRLGWSFPWASSLDCDFNRDFNVSFSDDDRSPEDGSVFYNYDQTQFPVDEAPGISVFYKDEAGEIFHTYSTFARGLEPVIGAYHFLDLVPKGRDEDGLDFSMAWLRHNDDYGNG